MSSLPWKGALHRSILRIRPAPLAEVVKSLVGIKREIIETEFGRFWVDPVSVLGRCLMDDGVFDSSIMDTLRVYLRPGGTFVDLGANEGFFTVLGARLVGPVGRVLAIEPQERLLPVLQKNLTLNELANVEVERSAVSDREGRATLYLRPTTNNGSSGLFEIGGETQVVELKPLSRVVDERGIDGIDLMKIDIEGSEYEAVMGSPELFRSGRIKTIALDFHPSVLTARGKSGEDIKTLLREAGYSHSSALGNDVFWLPQ